MGEDALEWHRMSDESDSEEEFFVGGCGLMWWVWPGVVGVAVM